jgi:hypothetical protein
LSDKNPTEWGIFSDILQSEEDLFSNSNSDSSDCRICCTKNIQSGEFPLITYNLRNSPFSFQIQIPQVVGFRFVRKPTEWGIFFDFHQSEEFSEFQSTSDESFIAFSCFSIVTFLRMQLFVLFKSYIMRNFLWVPYLKEIELIQAKHICKTNCSSVCRISQKKCEV